jgi:hypothetical protein
MAPAPALLCAPGMIRVCFSVILCVACSGPQSHSVAIGGACQYDSDCARPSDGGDVHCPCGTCEEDYPLPLHCGPAGTVCSADETCVLSTVSGCMPSAKLGESCAMVNCVSGLYCDRTDRCATPGAVGQPCDPKIEESCAAPAFCDGASATCAAPRHPGEACDWKRYDRAECEAGSACSLVSNTCVTRQLNGASCTDDAGCLSDYCTPDHLCQTNRC